MCLFVEIYFNKQIVLSLEIKSSQKLAVLQEAHTHGYNYRGNKLVHFIFKGVKGIYASKIQIPTNGSESRHTMPLILNL